MDSLINSFVLAKSAISESSIEIHESFPILSQKIAKPADNQRVLHNQGAQNKTRTCTSLRSLVPETSVSTNFTIWA